jgi:hypothetical protein
MGLKMETSNCLDDLIECLWQILGSEMDRSPTFHCREKCLECIERLVGADHHYARCFKNFVQHGDDFSLLIAGGILNALREEIAKKEAQHACAGETDSRDTGFELDSQP